MYKQNINISHLTSHLSKVQSPLLRTGWSRCQLKPWALLLVMMLSLPAMRVQAADWMTYADKYSMESYNNHVRFNVFLCDLDGSNTFAKEDGGVYAQDGSGTKIWLIDLIYIEEGSDENAFGKVRARYCVGESRAWFANGYGQQEQQINFNSQDFLIQKWGSSNHYMTAKIDYYYPASMAGKTWTFYYKYKHNRGTTYTMKLGSAYLSNTMNYSHFNAGDFNVERTSPDKIKFTVPALPDDVSSKLSDIHKHEGTYKVTFTYTKQNNSTVVATETLACEKNDRKSYDITIPEEVGNPKRIDMNVEATDGLKDAVNYYWKDVKTFYKSNVFQMAPVPNSLRAEYRQFDKAADVSWNAYPSDGNNYLESTPYIYRVETDKDGKPLNGSWSKRGSMENVGTNQTLGYSDNGVSPSTYYKYMVLNVPKVWINNGINSSMLNNPSDDLINRLGYAESDVFETRPVVNIYNLQQDTTVIDKVRLTWQYSRVPVESSTVTFKVMRRTSEDGLWAEYASVSGDANPSAGAMLSFNDADLPSVKERYQYMIRLTLNDKDLFESSPLYAGLVQGSTVTKFEATKGTHDATVRLSWNAKQIGTENTTYVISRRYLNSNDEYMRINTTSGKAELYTYEDNTVQPGYFYDYMIEAYSGNMLQNSLTDAGFCQARGVISGRITFGTGTSVEDVRLSLRPSDSGEDNTVKGYSQRVDGASTGIAWYADNEEVDKLFGADKDFTVQMFLRPDDNLPEGAVFANIPYIGNIVAGSQTDEGYELFQVVNVANEVDLSTLTGNYVAQDHDVLMGTLGGNYMISIAEGATVTLKDVTIEGVNNYSYKWAAINCLGDATIYLEGSNQLKGFYDEYPGIWIKKDHTLTIKGNGSLVASSNDWATGIGGVYSINGGNIIIDGGTITSIGGPYSAGIGAARNAGCGFITITDNVT